MLVKLFKNVVIYVMVILYSVPVATLHKNSSSYWVVSYYLQYFMIM